tara:strand:+ start:447 stop:665 length:219 start_codon:yes stop_codon:yes gene_type:complete
METRFIKDVNRVFDVCDKLTKANLKLKYMYMYSVEDNHVFKHDGVLNSNEHLTPEQWQEIKYIEVKANIEDN